VKTICTIFKINKTLKLIDLQEMYMSLLDKPLTDLGSTTMIINKIKLCMTKRSLKILGQLNSRFLMLKK